jgi:dTDP-4-dehydrorhamnose reductase
MITLLGGTGYIGQAFADALRARGWAFQNLSRADLDYTRFSVLHDYLHRVRPEFLINAAGFTGKPNVDACETAQTETLLGNTVLPVTVAAACESAGIPFGHVSSGCIYAGAKIDKGGQITTQRDLLRPDLEALITKLPGVVRGFTEDDPPNFSFRAPPCSFYSGSKALAEEGLRELGECFVWRLRIPFDQCDDPRNYLTKLQCYQRVYDNFNSLSHRGDFVRACLDLWERRAPFGIYNVTNPGFVRTRQVVEMIRRILSPGRAFEFWPSDRAFCESVKAPRSNCILDVSKLTAAGIVLRPVEAALEDSLNFWRLKLPSNRSSY